MVSMVLVLLISFFANSYAESSFQLIQSYGTISYPSLSSDLSLTVILRALTLSEVDPSINITQYVDWYVGNYTFAQNMIVVLSDLHPEAMIKYPKEFNQTCGAWDGTGWSWVQIKALIDRFHSYGWKVWMSTTGIAWDNQWMYNYITQQHPELTFADANGYRANNGEPAAPVGNTLGNKSVWYNCLIPDFWAKYATSDSNLGIATGSRLIDIMTTKLGQMIAAGLQFDGWEPTDGWNGWNLQGYNFPDFTNPIDSYSFSPQETDEWANDTTSGYGLPTIGIPSGWNGWNITQRSSWILYTANNLWHEWWCYRFSQMYLEIKNAIKNNNPNPEPFYSIVGADGSCMWTSGNLGGQGLLNFTMVANDGSIDRFQVDPEVTRSEQPKLDAWVAALVKSKDARLTPLIGIQATSWADNVTASPLWQLEQQYLAQVQDYVWFNGVRYHACNITDFSLQYPPSIPAGNVNWATSSWNNTAIHDLFSFIQSTIGYFINGSPVYLGPTLVLPYIYDGYAGQVFPNWINYTIAQFADTYNLQKSNSYITSGMGTILFEESSAYLYPLPQSEQNIVDNMFANGSLNVIIGANGMGYLSPGAHVSSIWSSGSESEVASTLKLNAVSGDVINGCVLSDIQDSVAQWIASGYAGVTYSSAYTYTSGIGFIPIEGDSTNNVVNIGIYYNASSGNFLYMTDWYPIQQLINRAIYWASMSPINASEPMLDYEVFKLSNGTMVIPMMNHNSAISTWSGEPISLTLQINPTMLGLGAISNYVFYWANDWKGQNVMTFSNWNNISVTLNSMAGVLVIAEK